MTLKDKYASFLKTKTEMTFSLRELIIQHKDKIDLASSIAHTMRNFYVDKTPFALVEGAVDAVIDMVIDKAYFATDYFTEINGWEEVNFDRFPLDGFFTTIINKYPSRPFKFESDNAKVKFVQLPFAEIGYLENGGSESLFYRKETTTSEAVFNFLVDEKFKELDTNFIGFGYKERASSNRGKETVSHGSGATLYPEPLVAIDSPKADHYTAYIQKYLDKGISRSLLFYGPPGTGKTTLSQTIIKNLNFRTLNFRFDNNYDYNLFFFIIKYFKIEAVILDDCDQIHADRELLELLEMLKRETKLVIGLVNSLQEFHPAILRPGRMDEIILIDSLETQVIVDLLGPLTEQFAERVAKWPVAYINELIARSKVVEGEELEEAFETLNSRVVEQLESLE